MERFERVVHDKQLVAMSMGGWLRASRLCCKLVWNVELLLRTTCGTTNTSRIWSLYNIRWLPAHALWFAANVKSAYGSSTLLHAQIVLNKYKTSMLSTLQDYHKQRIECRATMAFCGYYGISSLLLAIAQNMLVPLSLASLARAQTEATGFTRGSLHRISW